ncbi:MAG: hypothetical protein V7742_07855 [Halioglobus sp.]
MLIVAAAYSLGLPGTFLFDDAGNLQKNPSLTFNPLILDEWRTATFSSHAGALQRPIAMFTFALNAASSGLSAGAFKTTNIAVHVITGILIYFFSLEVFRAVYQARVDEALVRSMALCATAIWVLHPLHISTVLYSVQRMAQLSTLFVITGLLLFFRCRNLWAHAGASLGEVLAAVAWLSLLGLFAVLSKENGALLPWLVAVSEISIFRGIWRGRFNRRIATLGWLAFLAPLILIGLIFAVKPDIVLSGYSVREFSLEERVYTQTRVLWSYVYWFSLPQLREMGLFHDDIKLSGSLINPITTLWAALAWFLLLAFAFALRRRFKLLLFVVLFYLVAHSMESSFIALELVFEHRNYLASVSLAILVTVCIYGIGQARPGSYAERFAIVVALCLLGLLCLRASVWSDEISLTHIAVKNHPESVRSRLTYSQALYREYRQQQALDNLSHGEGLALAVTAREQLLSVRRQNPQELRAYVMLLQTDAVLFPGLENYEAWFTQINLAVKSVPMSLANRSAISALVKCVEATDCGSLDPDDIGGVIATLLQRYPGDRKILYDKYKYLAAIDSNPVEREELLRQIHDIAPGWQPIHYYRVKEKVVAGEVAGMYEEVGAWILADPKRQELLRIKSLFSLD